MGSNPSTSRGDTLPVENVSWYDAIEYCNRRSEREGLSPAYTIDKKRSDTNNLDDYDKVKWLVMWNRNASGYRLPTEAEWEYAAKGGNKDPMTFEYAGSNSPDGVAWYFENSGFRSHPVGTKQPNSLGLYDMSGNVEEWCWDWFGSYSSESQTDSVGASSGRERILRGGSYFDDVTNVRSFYRGFTKPSYRSGLYGFRLVRAE
jgi:formylglycine-generating enzyme required for sulfatase activity